MQRITRITNSRHSAQCVNMNVEVLSLRGMCFFNPEVVPGSATVSGAIESFISAIFSR